METGLIRSWKGLLALYTVAGFIETIFWGQMNAFTPLYLGQLGVPESEIAFYVGLTAAIVGFAGLPFLPFWGALADRYARKPVIVRSFIVYLFAGAAAVFAHNVWVFVLGRALMSLSLGNTGLMMTTLAERTPSQRQGLAFSIMNSAGPIGVFIGPLVGGPIVDHFGFRTLLAINCGIMFCVVLALSFGYKDSYQGISDQPVVRMALGAVRLLLTSRRLVALFAALFCLFAGWVMANTYLPVIVTRMAAGPNSGQAIGMVLGASGFVALVLAPLFGSLADRFGHWRALLAGAALLVVLWPAPALLAGRLAPFTAAWAMAGGLASGVFSISFTVLSSSASPQLRGRVMAFAYLPINLGSFFGPALGAQLTRQNVYNVFPFAAGFTLLSIALLLLARRQPVQE